MKGQTITIRIPMIFDWRFLIENLVDIFSLPWQKIQSNQKSKYYIAIIGLVIFMFLPIFGLTNTGLCGLFLFFLFYKIDARALTIPALAFLMSAPIASGLGKGSLSEVLMIYSFFFLSMLVFLEIIQVFNHSQIKKNVISRNFLKFEKEYSQEKYQSMLGSNSLLSQLFALPIFWLGLMLFLSMTIGFIRNFY